MLILSMMRLMPSEIGKVREQQACSQAEFLASSFLNLPGNHSDWINNNLSELGFSTEDRMVINYTKWNTAKTRGFYNITTDISNFVPFYLKYDAYAINWSTDSTPSPLANETENGSVHLVRRGNNLVIYAGANDTTLNLNLKLYFPFATVTNSGCDGDLESSDTNTTTTRNGGNEIYLDWYVSANDLDCINLTASATPEVVFIKDMYFENSTKLKTGHIYLGNHTILNNDFGSTGYRDPTKNFCTIERAGLLANNNELIPIKMWVISWR